jgi:hypothetical protein
MKKDKEFQVGDILKNNKTMEEAVVMYKGCGERAPKIIGLESNQERPFRHDGSPYWKGVPGCCFNYDYYSGWIRFVNEHYTKIGHKKVEFQKPEQPEPKEETKPKESKADQWKVGDRYAIPSASESAKAGTIFTVKEVKDGWVKAVDADGHTDNFEIESWWEDNAKRLSAEKKPNITVDKLGTIGYRRVDKQTTVELHDGRVGTATCNPHDEFNEDTGLLYALCRAIGREDVVALLEAKAKQDAAKEIKEGDTVVFISREQHASLPKWYPRVGTKGKVVEITNTGFLIEWPKGSLSGNPSDTVMYCEAVNVRKVKA